MQIIRQIIAVMRNGDFFFGNDRVRPYGFSDRIRQKIKAGSEPTIYIRADARCKYRGVKDVLDEIHSSGVEHVVFLVDQRKQSGVGSERCPARLIPAPSVFGSFLEKVQKEGFMQNPTTKIARTFGRTAAEETSEEQIRLRAYELYEARGRKDGHDLEHWLEAKAEITGRAEGAAA